MGNSFQVVIAMAADWAYAEHVMTLIKSVCYHQKNVQFYLFNKDYPIEWFHVLNTKLNPLHSQILDAKVNYTGFEQIQTLPHITETTFYRYLLAELPAEKVLYLDSDIVVETPLVPLFQTDLKGNLLAAIPDLLVSHMEHWYLEFPDFKPYFNAGVLLADTAKWREAGTQHQLFDLSSKHKVHYADQDILNIYFKNKWLALDAIYNYQTGAADALERRQFFQAAVETRRLANQAQIVHYTTEHKPWLASPPHTVLLRERYWHYRNLQWNEIWQHHLKK